MTNVYSATVTLRGVTHHLEVTKPPVSQGRKLADLSPEERADYEAIRSRRDEDLKRFEEIDRQRNGSVEPEARYLVAPNVATLSREQARRQIESMSELIQSGQSENQKLYTGNGGRATSNYRQYIYWMQLHVQALDGAGQSTLAQV
jgi:hypothetical protein